MPARLRFAAVALMLAGLTWLGLTAARYSVAGSASSNAAREIERMSRSQGNSGPWWTDDLTRATHEVPGDPTAHELLALGIAWLIALGRGLCSMFRYEMTPAAIARLISRVRRPWTPRWTATSDEEQAVSRAMLGPRRSSQ